MIEVRWRRAVGKDPSKKVYWNRFVGEGLLEKIRERRSFGKEGCRWKRANQKEGCGWKSGRKPCEEKK